MPQITTLHNAPLQHTHAWPHPQNTQVDFGAAYMGERRSRTITLHNASPAEARFDLSFGPASEMGPADGGGLGGEDAHAAFLRLARIRVRALPYY